MNGSRRRLALSLFRSAICVAVLGLAVHAGFDRIRFRVVTGTAEASLSKAQLAMLLHLPPEE